MATKSKSAHAYRICAAVLFAALASSCGQQPEQDSAAASPAAAASTRAPEQPTCGSGRGFDALPAGVCLPAEYVFVEQKNYTDKQGRDRMRLTFNFNGADADTTAKSIAATLKAAGYNPYPPTRTADGAIQVSLTKAPGTLYLQAKQKEGAEPAGTFFLDFLAH